MDSSIECPKCHRSFRIPAQMVGKRIRCLQCHSVFRAQNEGIQPAKDLPLARSLDGPAGAGAVMEALPADEEPPERRTEAPLRRKDYGTPGYLWALAVLPWGILVLTLGGCIPGMVAAALSSGGMAIARLQHKPVGFRLTFLLLLNGLGYGSVLCVLFAVLILPRLSKSGPTAQPNPGAQTNVPPGHGAPPARGAPPVHDVPQPHEVPLPPVTKLFERGPRQYLADLPEFGVKAGP